MNARAATLFCSHPPQKSHVFFALAFPLCSNHLGFDVFSLCFLFKSPGGNLNRKQTVISAKHGQFEQKPKVKRASMMFATQRGSAEIWLGFHTIFIQSKSIGKV